MFLPHKTLWYCTIHQLLQVHWQWLHLLHPTCSRWHRMWTFLGSINRISIALQARLGRNAIENWWCLTWYWLVDMVHMWVGILFVPSFRRFVTSPWCIRYACWFCVYATSTLSLAMLLPICDLAHCCHGCPGWLYHAYCADVQGGAPYLCCQDHLQLCTPTVFGAYLNREVRAPEDRSCVWSCYWKYVL